MSTSFTTLKEKVSPITSKASKTLRSARSFSPFSFKKSKVPTSAFEPKKAPRRSILNSSRFPSESAGSTNGGSGSDHVVRLKLGPASMMFRNGHWKTVIKKDCTCSDRVNPQVIYES